MTRRAWLGTWLAAVLVPVSLRASSGVVLTGRLSQTDSEATDGIVGLDGPHWKGTIVVDTDSPDAQRLQALKDRSVIVTLTEDA